MYREIIIKFGSVYSHLFYDIQFSWNGNPYILTAEDNVISQRKILYKFDYTNNTLDLWIKYNVTAGTLGGVYIQTIFEPGISIDTVEILNLSSEPTGSSAAQYVHLISVTKNY